MNNFLLLKNSLLNFDLDQVKKYLDEISANDLLNNNNFDIIETNILEILLSSLCITNGKNHDNIEKVIRCLLEKQPKLISNYAFVLARRYGKYYNINLVDILSEFDETEYDPVNSCSICFSNRRQDEMVKNICQCQKINHLYCIQKYILFTGTTKCNVCNNKYPLNEKRFINKIGSFTVLTDEIFFPDINIYPIPLMTDEYIFGLTNKYEMINYAIIYLQLERFKKLLNELNDDEFKEYITRQSQNIYCIPFKEIDMENHRVVLNNLPSNYSKKYNKIAYKTIEDLILNRCIITNLFKM